MFIFCGALNPQAGCMKAGCLCLRLQSTCF
jgi:hypothetical protein